MMESSSTKLARAVLMRQHPVLIWFSASRSIIGRPPGEGGQCRLRISALARTASNGRQAKFSLGSELLIRPCKVAGDEEAR